MSLLKQINDKGAVIEWCPLSEYGNLVALGTKDSAGSGFDDYGGELELHMMNFSDRSSKTTLVGRAKATSRFASIAWSKMAIRSSEYSYGLIATGMIDGTINLWDPSKLASDDPEPLLVAVEQHTGPISGLQFNPHRESSHLLASGGADCEIFVTSLDRPETPNVFIPAPPPSTTKHTADITKVAWNTQVAHILASSAQNGSCIVWDLRQKKAWCELKDPSGGCVSDIAWNPDQGLHLITAGGDDKNPVLKLWDLRSSTSLPLATLQGHTEGILSVSWCPSDPSLLLSCGKDNRTMLWDLFNLQPVYDIPSNSFDTHQQSNFPGIHSTGSSDDNNFMFNNLASTVGSRRYHVAWSPCLPAVISTCSFDRSVQFYSLSGAKSKLGRAPKWLRKPVGATFGFGGKLATFDNRPNTNADPKKNSSGSVEVKLHQVIENPELVTLSDTFQEALLKGDYPSYCNYKASTVNSYFDKQIWELMNIICFDKSAREGLLKYLGFDSNHITSITNDYITNITALKDSKLSQLIQNSQLSDDLHEKIQKSNINVNELVDNVLTSEEAEPIIRQALVVGNFNLAVDCCIEAGLMSEALLIAQCGDDNLWRKTQQIYFERTRQKKFFVTILESIIKSELMNYVLQSDLNKWKETLAILSTYGKSEEFPILCEKLGERLQNEKNDLLSSTLCYMCAINMNQTISNWIINLKQIIYANHNNIDIYALQEFIEKVIIYTQYNTQGENSTVQLSDECLYYFTEYSKLLASQGKTNVAGKFLKSNTQEEQILRDRLYHSQYLKPMGSRPPIFPFESVIVNTVVQIDPNSQVPNQVHARNRGGSMDKTHQNTSNHNNQKVGTHPSHIPQLQQQQQQPQHHHQQHHHQQQQQHSAGGVSSTTTTSTTPNRPQQQQQQQHQHHQQQQSVQQQTIQHTPVAPVTVAQLPPGWIQLVDPSTNRPYFVDQATGQSQWEPPVLITQPVVPTPTPTPIPIPNNSNNNFNPSSSSTATTTATNTINTPTTTTFQPKDDVSAIQYNHQNNVTNTSVNSSNTTSIPVSSVQENTSISSDSCVGELQNMFTALQGKPLNATDKRQLPAISQSITALVQQYHSNQVSPEVLAKLEQMVAALNVKNVHGANAIHTELVNTYWNQHKDWIRGLKYLVQLVGKY